MPQPTVAPDLAYALGCGALSLAFGPTRTFAIVGISVAIGWIVLQNSR